MELRCLSASSEDTLCSRCFSGSRSLLLLPLVLLLSDVEALRVVGGSVRVELGGTAVLPCHLTDTEEVLHQISWQRKTKEKVRTDNFYTIQPSGPVFVNGNDRRFQFIGSFKDNNGTLQLANVLLKDEGTYTCIFTVFPSGNHKTEIPLTVFVLPSISVEDEYPLEGKEERLLATCTAAGSRPAAQVTWVTDSLGDKVRTTTTNSTQTDSETTTTVSSLWGLPTRDINGQEVQCVVKSATQEKSIKFTVQIYFPPVEVNIDGRAADTFECLTDANPDAEFTWSRAVVSLSAGSTDTSPLFYYHTICTNNGNSSSVWPPQTPGGIRRSGQPLPQSAVAEGGQLKFLSVSSDLNGLYQCEASNQYGKTHGSLYVHVSSASCTACWVLFSLLLALIASLAAAAAVYYFYFLRRGESPPRGPQRLPTSEGEREEETANV